MKLILKETINSLGIIGAEVEVADGYARNYLLPKGKAVRATEANRNMIKNQKAKFDLQIAKEKDVAEDMAQKIEGLVCCIPAKVTEADRLYGSIGVKDIIRSLSKQGITVEKRMVLLKEPIKNTGEFKVPIRIYKEVKPEITVSVTAE